jgi:hypothetical protein
VRGVRGGHIRERRNGVRGVRGGDVVGGGREYVHRVYERGEFAGEQHGVCRVSVPAGARVFTVGVF